MKVIFYILIFCLFLISCNDDEEKIIPSLVGEWEVVDSYFHTNSNQGICFSIGDSLYMGLGIPFPSSYSSPNELRRYTKTSYGEAMKDFPGKPRIGAVAFTIKDKAYIGLGKSITDEKTYYKDFWVYDATSNSWDSLTFEFPGDAVVDAVAFSLNGMGYVGTGLKANGLYSGEFYQFDPQYVGEGKPIWYCRKQEPLHFNSTEPFIFVSDTAVTKIVGMFIDSTRKSSVSYR